MRHRNTIRFMVWGGLVGTLLLILFTLTLLLFTSCNSAENGERQSARAADGLNLHALIGVVQRVQTGEDLERQLNVTGGINNLDLDNDGKVDFLSVTEFRGVGMSGYSLVAHLGDESSQEVAEVTVTQTDSEYIIQVHGNEQIYGPNVYVTSTVSRSRASMMPFLLWAFMPRPVYVHPYVVGVYPSWYVRPIVIPRTQYVQRTTIITKTITVQKPTTPVIQKPAGMTNPNAGKSSETVKAPLAAPTATQKQFQERPENKPVASGGFETRQTQPSSGVAPKQEVTQPKATPSTAPPTNTQRQFQQRDTSKPAQSGGFGSGSGGGSGGRSPSSSTTSSGSTSHPSTSSSSPRR